MKALNARKMSKKGKRIKNFTLPETSIITEWFSEDQKAKLELLADTNTAYSKYDVYQVYNEHSKAL